MEAVRTNAELRIDYQRYQDEQREEHLRTFTMQPYALKVYNRRWYLLGFPKEDNDIRTIALDRVIDMEALPSKFEMPADFDARNYFANVVGVYVEKDLPVEKVRIRAYGAQADYLRSSPLHKSQSEGNSKHGEYAEFSYNLCVTPELISQLLAMGDKVEVLEPEMLRIKMKERICNTFNFYK
jgi:predicted DNA-binding transcriptional regulator YafY